MSSTLQTGTIRTRIPARLDRLPWSRWHWIVIIGLGTVWILDGLEVTVVGAVATRIAEDKHVGISAADISGLAASMYIAGACVGALLFGQLTDIFGRKKLFMITLGIYLVSTALTAFAFAPWWIFLWRFMTGMGIGGEYSAINSAIDELIPAERRGRVDIIINGSYWVGAAGGAGLSFFFLDKSIFPVDIGWRLAFGIGFFLGLVILLVRRNVPESPRWLFIHGREEEAERIVDDIERQVREDTGRAELEEPEGEITVRQRRSIPVTTIFTTLFKLYPKRTTLGFALFVGQAFLYNAILFGYSTILQKFFGVSSSDAPLYLIAFAGGNFLGPLLLGRLFDTWGRKPMIGGTYVLSGILLLITGVLFKNGTLTAGTLTLAWCVCFFFASAGVSAAYLTVSEVFPMETRALCIAVFYAIGTGVGGIIGPLLFSHLVATGNASKVFGGLALGAGLMIVGGIVEFLFGVKAERQSLENIAKPLTAVEAEGHRGSIQRSAPATI